MGKVVKYPPEWDSYATSWVLSQKISTYGDYHLDYECTYKTLKRIAKIPGYLFIFDKEPVYKTISEWLDKNNWWILREYRTSCGSRAVFGHIDLKEIDKIKNSLFIFDKEEIV